MRSWFLIAVVLCLTHSQHAAAEDRVTLAWTFKAGETLLLALEARSETVELKRQGGVPVPDRQEKTQRQFATYEIRVLEAQADGAALLSLQLHDLLLVMVSNRVTVRVDARRDGEQFSVSASVPSAREDRREELAELLGRLVRGMMDCKYRVRIARTGELKSLEVVGDPLAGLEGLRRRKLREMAKALRALIDAEAMARAALSQVFVPLPGKPVDRGASWSTDRAFDALGMTLKSKGRASFVRLEGEGSERAVVIRDQSRNEIDTSRFAEAYGRALSRAGLHVEVEADLRASDATTLAYEARFSPARGRVERVTWEKMEAALSGTLTVKAAGRSESVEMAVGKRGTQSLTLVSREQMTGFERALGSAKPKRRAAAAEALARIGPAAASSVPALLRTLTDRDARVRRNAAAALGACRTGAPKVLVALDRALEDPAAPVRAAAARAIGRQGPAAASRAPALVAAIRSGRVPEAADALADLCGPVGEAVLAAYGDDAYGRSDAISVLGKHAPAHADIAVPALLHVAKLRGDASYMLETLTKFGRQARPAEPLLADLLASEDEGTREGARKLAEAIVRVGERSLDALARQLKEEPSEFRRSDVADVLAKVRPVRQKTVTTLTDALKDKSHYVRYQSAWALGQLRRDALSAIPALVAAVNDPHPDVREWAINALGSMAPEAKSAIPAIIANLDHEEYTVRLYAVQALQDFGPLASAAIPKLLEVHARRARGPSVQETSIQKWAAVALHAIEPEGTRTIPALTASLKGRSYPISAEAAIVLGRYGVKARAAIPAIIELLHEEHWLDRRRPAALKAIAGFGPAARAALPRIRQILPTKDIEEGISAARALFQIAGSTEGIPALVDRLDESAWHPALAARALAEMGPKAKAAVPALLQVLTRKSASNAAAAAETLAQIRDASPRVLDGLRAMMNRLEARARIAAAAALFELERDADAVLPTLVAALDGEESVRELAAHTLGEMGKAATPAVPRLARIKDEDDRRFVREAAAEALRKIRGAGKR